MEWDWSALAAHPTVQSGLVPLGSALVVTVFGRYSGGMSPSGRGAGSRIGFAFLTSFWLPRGRWWEVFTPVYLVIPGFAPVMSAVSLALSAESPDDANYR